jgi:aerobactin synthase
MTTRQTDWQAAGCTLLARMVAELSYEEMLHPDPVGNGGYRLDLGEVTYTFTARRAAFGAWVVDPASVRRVEGGSAGSGCGTAGADPRMAPPASDPRRFVLDAAKVLGWPGETVADVLRELTATQDADVRIRRGARPAAALADVGYLDLEGYQTGHPCMVLNKGRLGFSAADADRYTPEARHPFRLRWVAAHPALASIHTMAGLSPFDLLERELDRATRAAFAATMVATLAAVSHAVRGPDGSGPDGSGPDGPCGVPGGPAGYVWLPVHPWQWDHVIAPLFAAELASGQLVDLGEAPDRYLPLQSVRTLANVDRPGRANVKLALMIRNTLVWRGLSPADAVAGPTVSRWLLDIRDRDDYLRDTGVLPLTEVAGATVRHPAFDAVDDTPYRLRELLGVLWREPVTALLAAGERARTFASLLLVGSDGRPLVAELVARSGLDARAWLARLLRALLPPLLHYLHAYGVAFTPHGENVVLVFDSADVPTRIAVKDFGADLELIDGLEMPEHADLPAAAARHMRRWPAADLAHSILSAVCAGHFRFFSVLVDDHLGIRPGEFWAMVRAEILHYLEEFPDLAGRVDLLAPTFDRVCLNREQLAGAGFHDRSDRDGEFDRTYGIVVNPLHQPINERRRQS